MKREYDLFTYTELLNYYYDYHKNIRGYIPEPENLTKNEVLKRIEQLDSFTNSQS